MKVARHGFDPRISHADQGTAEIGVRKSDGLEHGACAGTVAPLSDSTADVLKIHSERLHNSRHGWKIGKQSTTKYTKLREGILLLGFPLCVFASFVVHAFGRRQK